MTKKEWENCNTCWTCKHRWVTCNKVVSHRKSFPRIFCGYGADELAAAKILTNRDIINSPDCPNREKEGWRGRNDKT